MAPRPIAPLRRTLALGVAAAIAIVLLSVAIRHLSDSYGVVGLPPLTPLTGSGSRLVIKDPNRLERLFDESGYELASVRSGKTTVPQMLLRELPDGFAGLKDTDARKSLFIRTVLPLVLRVNRHITAQRKQLLSLFDKRRAGAPLKPSEERWLSDIARLYRTEPGRTETLRRRVAPIPPSLALAQAAAETGWGSSRFALDGNALFGQWTFTEGEGLKPRDASSDSRHAVKSYEHLVGSVWDYTRNINSNAAYRALRDARARGKRSGLALAGYLKRYSQRATDYVDLLRDIIRQNDLAPLDTAKLADHALD
ncbi:MAG: Bax protein [Alphaproteobacteria bacterium]|jgi:Bax protein